MRKEGGMKERGEGFIQGKERKEGTANKAAE